MSNWKSILARLGLSHYLYKDITFLFLSPSSSPWYTPLFLSWEISNSTNLTKSDYTPINQHWIHTNTVTDVPLEADALPTLWMHEYSGEAWTCEGLYRRLWYQHTKSQAGNHRGYEPRTMPHPYSPTDTIEQRRVLYLKRVHGCRVRYHDYFESFDLEVLMFPWCRWWKDLLVDNDTL